MALPRINRSGGGKRRVGGALGTGGRTGSTTGRSFGRFTSAGRTAGQIRTTLAPSRSSGRSAGLGRLSYDRGRRSGSAHLGISTPRFGVSLDRRGGHLSANVRIGRNHGNRRLGGGLYYDGQHIRSRSPYYNRSHYRYGHSSFGSFGHFNTADYYPYRRHRSYGHYYSPYYSSYYSPYYSSYYSPYLSVGFGSSYYAPSYYPYSGHSVVYYNNDSYDRGYDDYDVNVYGTTNVYVGDGSVEYASPSIGAQSEIQYEQATPALELPAPSPPILESLTDDGPEAHAPVEPDATEATIVASSFDRGFRAFVAGNYQEAVERYTDALLAGEERGLSSLMYGVSAFAVGEFATAGAAVRRSLLLRPDLIESPIDLRSMYADPMVLDGQLGRLANFVRVDPGNRSAKFLLAYLHFAAGQPEYTATLAAELTKADPDDGLAKHLYDQAKRATREAENPPSDNQP